MELSQEDIKLLNSKMGIKKLLSNNNVDIAKALNFVYVLMSDCVGFFFFLKYSSYQRSMFMQSFMVMTTWTPIILDHLSPHLTTRLS